MLLNAGTNAADAVRSICVARVSVSRLACKRNYLSLVNAEKPYNSRLDLDDQSVEHSTTTSVCCSNPYCMFFLNTDLRSNHCTCKVSVFVYFLIF